MALKLLALFSFFSLLHGFIALGLAGQHTCAEFLSAEQHNGHKKMAVNISVMSGRGRAPFFIFFVRSACDILLGNVCRCSAVEIRDGI